VDVSSYQLWVLKTVNAIITDIVASSLLITNAKSLILSPITIAVLGRGICVDLRDGCSV